MMFGQARSLFFVIPAKAGIQSHQGQRSATLDPRLRGDDGKSWDNGKSGDDGKKIRDGKKSRNCGGRLFLAGLLLPLALPATARAQHADTAAMAAQAEAMHKLDWMHGKWRGEARFRMPGGPEQVMVHTERVGTMLDGSVTVVEGKSFDASGKVPFNAFAVISFDGRTGGYAMQSYTGGRAGSFPMAVADRGYSWETPAGPRAKIHYKASFDGTTWTETGDYVAEGQPARPFFKMVLKRIGDSDWPMAGSVTRD
jgi:hypothetical protein